MLACGLKNRPFPSNLSCPGATERDAITEPYRHLGATPGVPWTGPRLRFDLGRGERADNVDKDQKHIRHDPFQGAAWTSIDGIARKPF